MINHCLYAFIFADVKIPGVAGRVTANFRGIFHRHQRGRSGADRKFLACFLSDGGAAVPICVKREQKPVIVIDEGRLDFVFHLVGLAAKLRAVVRNLHRLAVFVRTLVGDFAGLGLPLPLVSDFEQARYFAIPRVADRFDLIPRI